jgi:hypothetical protein
MKANIYVSATYRDLTDHRKAVCNAIRALGHVDVAMEHYVAEPTRPFDTHPGLLCCKWQR